MSWYDGLAVDPAAANECAQKLSSSAETIGKSKRIACEDYVTTIAANGKGTAAINSMNVNRTGIGEYLSIDDENFQAIVDTIYETDETMAGEYKGQ